MGVRAYVGLGSNLGESEAILDSACTSLHAARGTRVLRRSANLRSAPVGGPAGQLDYHNGVVELETELQAEELLDLLQSIESDHGRRRSTEQRWGSRTLDLDLLLYGEVISESKRLVLPHPRLTGRMFVLVPLGELQPDLLLPHSGETVQTHLERLRESTSQVLR